MHCIRRFRIAPYFGYRLLIQRKDLVSEPFKPSEPGSHRFRPDREVAELASHELVARGHPLHVQGLGVPNRLLIERFRQDERSVLFGVSSFWQGIDVRGRALRNVIITRLPFEVPDLPLVQARQELVQSRGGNAFMDDQLPRAILRFKQGFGRLVRSATDSGRVVVLDPRIATKRYGRLFLDALPEGLEPRIIRPPEDERFDDGPAWD